MARPLRPEPTDKQKKVLDFIEQYQLERGASPTIREIGKFLKVSSDNSVLKHLTALERKGFIKRRLDIPRGIAPLPNVRQRLDQPGEVRLPVLGSIPAGGPVLSEEHIEDWLTLSEDTVYKPEKSFILRVKGDSMIEAGIFEGDYVIACSSLQPHDKDIVIALVDHMNTVKTYRRSPTGPYLQPENSAYEDIYPEDELEIQGVVTGLFRKIYKRR